MNRGEFMKSTILVIAGLFLIGCGGSSKVAEQSSVEDKSEMDELSQLLGLSENGDQKGFGSEKDSSKTGLKKQAESDSSTNQWMNDVIKELEGKLFSHKNTIKDLEIEVESRALKIDELLAELAIKDEKIDDLKIQLKSNTAGKTEAVAKKKNSPVDKKKSNQGGTGSEGVKLKNAVTKFDKNITYKANYDVALAQYQAKKYQSAITIFEQLIGVSKKHDLSDNCQYWIGECYFALGNYQQSLSDFQKVFHYSKSNKNDDAQFKIGRCFMLLGNKKKAMDAFEKVISNFPESEYVSKAKDYLKNLGKM